jgi:hypothetical protein
MPDRPPLVHHICPYLCCHLQHVAGACPLERCENEPCGGADCWWYDRRAEPPPRVSHVASRWIYVHRDGGVPVP